MDRKARIQGALISRGKSQQSIAAAMGVSEATVSKVIAGTYPLRSVRSKRMRAAVLEEIGRQSGIPVGELQVLTAPREAAAAA